MHPVRVIHGSGQVLYLSPNITVEEVLHYYPHHFLCQPGLNSYSGWRSNQMLSLETELQSGCIYFLFPLPKLFPTAPTLPSQSCTCFQSSPKDQSANRNILLKHIQSPALNIFYDSPRDLHKPPSKSKWCLLSSCCKQNSKSQVSPEANLYSAGRGGVNLRSSPLQLAWHPRLGCISEENDIDVCLQDVKQFCGKFWKGDNQT